jgi:hypothetical protein
MKIRIRALVAAAGLLALSACSEPVYSGVTAMPNPPDSPKVGHAYPYHLLIRCGIDYAFFAGHIWQADKPLPAPSDAHGYPYAYGDMTLLSPGRAKFTWPGKPEVVTFHPTATPPRCT